MSQPYAYLLRISYPSKHGYDIELLRGGRKSLISYISTLLCDEEIDNSRLVIDVYQINLLYEFDFNRLEKVDITKVIERVTYQEIADKRKKNSQEIK